MALNSGFLKVCSLAAYDFRSPAPPAIALVGLLGMLAGEKLWPMGRQLMAGWIS
ncbi:DUF1427 family protein [Pseudomonas sp.]|uniref:DUF1427 family protein n=1 Tax=Pseudomonas sp. TaxID=306 RepID=UPI00258378C3|nr:DUF1427 family protein [Pseudomonas sp.]